MNPNRLCIAILSLSATPALSIPAFAQKQVQLDELVVTAKGYESDTLETASAIEKLNPGEASASDNAGNLFKGKPGLAIQGDGGAWGGNPVIRGLKKKVLSC